MTICLALLAAIPCGGAAAPKPPALKAAVHAAATPQDAAVLVLELPSRRVLAAEQTQVLARMAATPGSTLKPFLLAAALREGYWHPETRIQCRRALRIGTRGAACAHPAAASAFDARQALAWSCNTYFARVAAAAPGPELVSLLRRAGFGTAPGLLPGEAAGDIRPPVALAQRQLLTLGLEGVRVTPDELAAAYAGLASDGGLPESVLGGLRDSVRFGMASDAAVRGLDIAGKTGTAEDPGHPWTHGWFAGWLPEARPGVLVVVFVPHGHGADAAAIAGRVFAAWQSGSR